MNPFDIIKNMQNIQSHMQNMQHKLETLRATGSAGAGMVEITINGKMEVQSITISEEVVDPHDISTLEVLIASAFNHAVTEMQQVIKQEATSYASTMNIPPEYKG